MASEIPFRFDIPCTFFHKAGEAGKERRIGGIISTEHKDKQGETVLQRGLNLESFLQGGWINDNHSRDTAGIVGYPLEVKRTVHKGKQATYFEGYLLEGHDPADKIWNLGNALQKTDRKLGFSIEGKVRRRAGVDGKVIAEADVSNVAITNCPVNTATGMEVLAKSMMALENLDDDLAKALAAGQAVSDPGVAPGEGFPLRMESLEGAPRPKRKKKKKKRRLSKAEALEVIQRRHPGLSPVGVERIWKWAISQSKGEKNGT